MTENSWCKSLPTQPLIWDPSRLAIAMECWRKHYYQTIRGLKRNGSPSIHLEWGKAYHACCEQFDTHILEGMPRENACWSALDLAFELSWDAEHWQPKWGEWQDLWQCTDPEFRAHKRKVGVNVKKTDRCKYAKQPWFEITLYDHPYKETDKKFVCATCFHEVIKVRKWNNYHSKKNRANLLRAVAFYCDHEDLVTPYKFPDVTKSVEVQTRLPLPIASPDKLGFGPKANNDPYELLCNIDSIVNYKNELCIRERKTTGLPKLDANYWRQFELNPQIDSYDLTASVLYIDTKTNKPPKIMVEATRLSATGEVEIQRQIIYIPEERRKEWLDEIEEKIIDSETRAKGVEIHGHAAELLYPRNTKACHGQYGTCTFFALCSAKNSEREDIIKADYHIERWDPLSAESFIEDE